MDLRHRLTALRRWTIARVYHHTPAAYQQATCYATTQVDAVNVNSSESIDGVANGFAPTTDSAALSIGNNHADFCSSVYSAAVLD